VDQRLSSHLLRIEGKLEGLRRSEQHHGGAGTTAAARRTSNERRRPPRPSNARPGRAGRRRARRKPSSPHGSGWKRGTARPRRRGLSSALVADRARAAAAGEAGPPLASRAGRRAAGRRLALALGRACPAPFLFACWNPRHPRHAALGEAPEGDPALAACRRIAAARRPAPCLTRRAGATTGTKRRAAGWALPRAAGRERAGWCSTGRGTDAGLLVETAPLMPVPPEQRRRRSAVRTRTVPSHGSARGGHGRRRRWRRSSRPRQRQRRFEHHVSSGSRHSATRSACSTTSVEATRAATEPPGIQAPASRRTSGASAPRRPGASPNCRRCGAPPSERPRAASRRRAWRSAARAQRARVE
jgi:hypothetical protein